MKASLLVFSFYHSGCFFSVPLTGFFFLFVLLSITGVLRMLSRPSFHILLHAKSIYVGVGCHLYPVGSHLYALGAHICYQGICPYIETPLISHSQLISVCLLSISSAFTSLIPIQGTILS